MDLTSVMMAIRFMLAKVPLLASAAQAASEAAGQATAAAQDAEEAAEQTQLLNMGLSVVSGQLNVTYGSSDEEDPENNEE